MLGNAPNARFLHWGYQHVGILESTQTLKFALPPTPTPDASQWNIGGVGSSGVGHVYFMYISCIFYLVCASLSTLAKGKLADAKADSSGIWTLIVLNIDDNIPIPSYMSSSETRATNLAIKSFHFHHLIIPDHDYFCTPLPPPPFLLLSFFPPPPPPAVWPTIHSPQLNTPIRFFPPQSSFWGPLFRPQ